jgi:HSP20 family protein
MVKIVRWTPREPAYRNTVYPFGQIFEELWRNTQPTTFANSAALRPAMDVVENDDEVVIRMDLPGLSPDDLNIQVDGDLLTISGEFAAADEQEDERYHYRERRAGEFKRSLRLSDQIDTEHVSATFEHGVLSLTLAKLPEAQPKQIKVQTA